ncbi:MAG: hypothetical protein AABW83_02820 [Nanoarchaeota archaeon]
MINDPSLGFFRDYLEYRRGPHRRLLNLNDSFSREEIMDICIYLEGKFKRNCYELVGKSEMKFYVYIDNDYIVHMPYNLRKKSYEKTNDIKDLTKIDS